MPRFAHLLKLTLPFLCPLCFDDGQRRTDSNVMWRGTKEDPGGLQRLSTTPFIPGSLSLASHPVPAAPKRIPALSSVTPNEVRSAAFWAVELPDHQTKVLPLYAEPIQLMTPMCQFCNTMSSHLQVLSLQWSYENPAIVGMDRDHPRVTGKKVWLKDDIL